jgi:hypothetical protein
MERGAHSFFWGAIINMEENREKEAIADDVKEGARGQAESKKREF